MQEECEEEQTYESTVTDEHCGGGKEGNRSLKMLVLELLDSLNSRGLCIPTYHTPALPWILGLGNTAVWVCVG